MCASAAGAAEEAAGAAEVAAAAAPEEEAATGPPRQQPVRAYPASPVAGGQNGHGQSRRAAGVDEGEAGGGGVGGGSGGGSRGGSRGGSGGAARGAGRGASPAAPTTPAAPATPSLPTSPAPISRAALSCYAMESCRDRARAASAHAVGGRTAGDRAGGAGGRAQAVRRLAHEAARLEALEARLLRLR